MIFSEYIRPRRDRLSRQAGEMDAIKHQAVPRTYAKRFACGDSGVLLSGFENNLPEKLPKSVSSNLK